MRKGLSLKHKLKMRSNFRCSGNKLKFGEVRDFVKEASTAETTTASVKPSPETNNDFDAALIEDDMASFNNFLNNKDKVFGLSENTSDLSTKIPILEETIPVYAKLKKNTNIALSA